LPGANAKFTAVLSLIANVELYVANEVGGSAVAG